MRSISRFSAIVVDAMNVYWTNDNAGTVLKMPKTGGTPVALAIGQTTPSGIAVDSKYVYWANNAAKPMGAIYRVPK